MVPDREHLRHTLDELHQQLAGVDNLDPDVRTQLITALADIQRVLRSPDAQPQGESSFTGQLGDAALHFEQTHPTLSGTIRSIIDALARMGI